MSYPDTIDTNTVTLGSTEPKTAVQSRFLKLGDYYVDPETIDAMCEMSLAAQPTRTRLLLHSGQWFEVPFSLAQVYKIVTDSK